MFTIGISDTNIIMTSKSDMALFDLSVRFITPFSISALLFANLLSILLLLDFIAATSTFSLQQ